MRSTRSSYVVSRTNKPKNFLLELDNKENNTQSNNNNNPDNTNQSDSNNTSITTKTQKCCTQCMKVLATLSFVIFWSIHVIGISPKHINTMLTKANKIKKNILLSSEEDKSEQTGKSSAESIMVLGPPWNYMRNVVMEFNVFDEDITFLWETRDSSGLIVKKMFKKCFDLPLDDVDINTIIDKYRRVEGITSKDIRMVATKFTEQIRGRMFAFFRHPYYIHLSHSTKSGSSANDQKQTVDNPMTRMILNQPSGAIDFKGLGTAKKVIREKCVVGLLDTEFIDESIKRISSYFGIGSGMSAKSCTRIYRSEMKLDPKGELMNEESKSWEVFIKDNYVDLQLYEFARSVFRAQRQTIVPRNKQIGSGKNNEEKKRRINI